MEYDRGDSYSLDFKSNRISFVSKSEGNCQHDHIPLNLKKMEIHFSGCKHNYEAMIAWPENSFLNLVKSNKHFDCNCTFSIK